MIYQVFPDRFAGAAGAQLPPFTPSVFDMEAHAGGTLGGIAARLDHLKTLGADALYLTPVFRARTNHKYDTATWDEVDSRFGGNDDFDALAGACRARGMGLILDGVFNHIGREHEWFRTGQGNPSADADAFVKWTGTEPGYHRWRGHAMLPEVNFSNPAVRQHLYGDEDSVVRRWLRRGATGWRLDCANDLGVDVCAAIAAAARAEGAPDGVVGEVMAYAEEWIADGHGLDGVMNYYFRETVIGMLSGEVPVTQAAHNLKHMARRYRHAALLRSWNMLSSHDTPRLPTLLPDADRRVAALALAFAYPGIPVIYYGEELGMTGGPDPANRQPMRWDAAESPCDIHRTIRHLAGIRRHSPALLEGGYLPMPQPGTADLLAFARTTSRASETVVVLLNASDSPLRARVFAPHSHLFDALPMRDLLGRAQDTRMASGRFDVDLPPWGVALYAPEDGTIPGYRFFRNQ
jgi:alpha-glucosidase